MLLVSVLLLVASLRFPALVASQGASEGVDEAQEREQQEGNDNGSDWLLRQEAVCSTRLQRRAWHTLSAGEKKAYIDAELCLMRMPARFGMRGARTIFDELQAVHVRQAEIIHFVGAFLPWHRYFLHTHESLLRSLCGYRGAQPYWDETRDAGRFAQSEIFDTAVGFGGGGRARDHCIEDGPFAWYVNAYGPGHQTRNHCIDRNGMDEFDNEHSRFVGQRYIRECLQEDSYEDAVECIEWNPHGTAHLAVGGQMANIVSSAGDPLFYLHHTFLDKLFWDWQRRAFPDRLREVGGPNINEQCTRMRESGDPDANGPPCPPTRRMQLLARIGDNGDQTTLNHLLFVYGIMPNVTIRNVMDIGGGTLCYEYL